jgi:indolepyruvate ferredoxin oxidoreductase
VVAGGKKVIAAMKPGATTVVVNTHEMLPGAFTKNADYSLPTERIKRALADAAGSENVRFVDATRLANALFGSTIAQNMFLLGYAWQLGGLPVSGEAILKALELNGEAVEVNQTAFTWGRRAAVDQASVEALAAPREPGTDARRLSGSLDETIERRIAFLTAYQNAAYATTTGRSSAACGSRKARACREARRCPKRSRAICSSSWPIRTNTKSRGFIPTARSRNRSRPPSKAT